MPDHQIPSCSMWLLVARTDVPFMMNTIPHLVKMCNFPFEERVLALDTSPLKGEKAYRPGIATMEDLRNCGQKLLDDGVIDRVVDINFTPSYHEKMYRKHFGRYLTATHNYGGAPILGYIFTIEDCKSDYVLHFNSDMMLHQQPGYNWIEEAIQLMEKHPQMLFSRPLAGPPLPDGTIHQPNAYEKHPDGFYKFKSFGSRTYLINCKRFDKLLPLPIIWKSKNNNKILETIRSLPIFPDTNRLLGSWEVMISKKLAQTDYYRGDLISPKAWTLHPKDRSDKFFQTLPEIIRRIEAGDFPPGQAGHYDFISELWL